MKTHTTRWAHRITAVLTVIAICGLVSVAHAGAKSWNDDAITWMDYEAGLAAAKEQQKPICLIFYTSWCPHCTNYAKMFDDEKVAAKSKEFIMIRLDKDKHPEISKQYRPDGEYIPRTYFLSADGKLDADLTEERDKYKYFYSESDPGSILKGMDRALTKLAK